jgi:hypothetical protein
MFNFNRLVIATGIVSAISLFGLSNKAVAQISGTNNETATFSDTQNIPVSCQFVAGTFQNIGNLIDDGLGVLTTNDGTTNNNGSVSISCNSSGATIGVNATMTSPYTTEPTPAVTLTSPSLTGSGLPKISYTINSPVENQSITVQVDTDFAVSQLLAGNYTANVVLTITP